MITKLTLRNFKCFNHLNTIELGKINLLTGSNGRGKSSFLQSLLLLAQSMETDRRLLNHIELNGRFLELGNFEDICYRLTNEKTPTISFATDDTEENDITVELYPHQSKQRWANIKSLMVSGRELVEKTASAKGDELKGNALGATSAIAGLAQLADVYFISADRRGPTDYVKKDDNGDDRQVGIHGEFLVNALYRRDDAFMQELAQETSAILSGATVKVVETQTDYLRFYLDSANGTEGFRPSNVGFGYSYVLPIVTTLLLAECGAKVFIENPEAHLHPGAQSRLMNFMVKNAVDKGIQLFIETHSDHIINALRIGVLEKIVERRDARIIHFNRENTADPTPYQIKIDSQGQLSDYPQEFMDEWGIQMSQLV
ncbi:MAG: DUF3696 domain-containing protein [Prevotella conceptionensis]